MKNSQDIDQLYRGFRERLHSFIRSRVKGEDVAADILHEVFLKIHLRIGQLRSSDRVEAWLYAIARNAIVDHFKKQVDTTADVEELPQTPDEDNAYHKLGRSVHAMIDRLPETYREAIRLTELEEMPQTELARHLGISVSGAKSRVQRGRNMLKELLLECCHFDFDRLGQVIDYHEHTCCCCQKKKSNSAV